MERKKHQIWFFLLSVILFAISLGIAFFGVFYGGRILEALNAGGEVDLQTMGELLGGTLGVAVAFAGAWVAFKIASFANHTLVLQERREASRTANETLEHSIGKILDVQLHFEALLRHIDDFANGKDSAADRSSRDKLQQSAGALSLSIQSVLTNPLAISVLFALQEAKPEKLRTSRQRMLGDLSQMPRKMDQLRALVAARLPSQGFIDPLLPSVMMNVMFDCLTAEELEFEPLTKLGLKLGYVSDLEATTQIAPLSSLLGDRSSLVDLYEIREAFLLVVMRYFVYTPDEAESAIANVLSDTFYRDPAAREIILQSRPAKAFYSSGDINDERAAALLDASRRVHRELEALSDVVNAEDDDSRPAVALRRLAITAATEIRRRMLMSSSAKANGGELQWKIIESGSRHLGELVKQSRGFSAYQIYFATYAALALASEVGLFNWPISVIENLRKLRSGITLRTKLLGISEDFSSPSYSRQIGQVVEKAFAGRALPELDAMQPSLGDFGGRIPEPSVLGDILFGLLNTQLAKTIFRDSPTDEQEAIVSWLSGVRTYPLVIRTVCTAYLKFKAAEAPLDSPDVYLGKCFKMLQRNDNRSLCVMADLFGLRSDLTSGAVDIADPTTGLEGRARLVSREGSRAILEMNFRAPAGVGPEDLKHAMKVADAKDWFPQRATDGMVWSALRKVYSVGELESDLQMAQLLYKLVTPSSDSTGQCEKNITSL